MNFYKAWRAMLCGKSVRLKNAKWCHFTLEHKVVQNEQVTSTLNHCYEIYRMHFIQGDTDHIIHEASMHELALWMEADWVVVDDESEDEDVNNDPITHFPDALKGIGEVNV